MRAINFMELSFLHSRDAMMISITNCVTSIFAGLVIFSVVGFMAHEMNKSVEEVASQGNK